MPRQQKKIYPYIIYIDKQLPYEAFGKVYEAFDTIKKQKRIIKVVPKSKSIENSYLQNAIKRQLKMLFQITSSNILKCFQLVETQNNCYIIYQQFLGENLRKIIKQNSLGIKVQQGFAYLKQILKCFQTLTQKGIIYRNIKPQNILIDKQNKIKLCDFGFAKIFQKMKLFQLQKENVQNNDLVYLSPQILKHEKYSQKCDIFSLGMIFYQLFYGKKPIPSKITTQFQIIQWYLRNQIEFPPLKNFQDEKLAVSILDFIKKCLSKKQVSRFSWNDIYRQNIFKGEFYNVNELIKINYILSNLRLSIHSENIDVKNLIDSYPQKKLNQQKFYIFMQLLQEDISVKQCEEIMDLYGEIDYQRNQNIIVLENLFQPFQRAGILLQSLDFQEAYTQNDIVEKKRLKQQYQLIGTIYKDIASFQSPIIYSQNTKSRYKPSIKCCEAIRLLRNQIINAKIDLVQFLDIQMYNFRTKKKEVINSDEFFKLLRYIYPYFEKDDALRIFNILDLQNKKTLRVKELCKILSRLSGKSYRLGLVSK